MKNKIVNRVILFTILLVIAVFLNNCKKEDKCPEVNYTSIDQTLADAQQRYDNAVEGNNPGEYLPGSKNELQQAIDVTSIVRNKQCVTQQELNAAVSVLEKAVDDFESKMVPDCPDVDYTVIDQAITDAQQMHDNAVEGINPGEYEPGAKAELQQAIDTAQSVRDKQCVTQDELNTATSTLENAIVVFESKMVPEVDYTIIDLTIADARQRHDNAVEGNNPGEYLPGAKAELQQAIDLAQSVRDTDGVTQSELNMAVVALNAAINVFESKKIPDLSDNLVAHWLFNGDGADATGNGHDGTASAGHPNWGGGMPEPAEDRHGNADYCYKFVDGGNFVVPNTPAFRPPALTISVWMKLYDTWAHNYFISNDRWDSWKFQVQDANKPFFTAHFMKDDGSGEGWADHDSNFGILDLDTWYQVVVTYTAGKMIFYIDGEKVQEWDDFPTGTLIAPHAGIDLCIGQALPTAGYDVADHQWEDWLGYFKGYLDDMRFYNVMLTGAQVSALYDFEKANVIE